MLVTKQKAKSIDENCNEDVRDIKKFLVKYVLKHWTQIDSFIKNAILA